MVKNLPAMQETQVRSLGPEDPLEKGIWSIKCSIELCLKRCDKMKIMFVFVFYLEPSRTIWNTALPQTNVQ